MRYLNGMFLVGALVLMATSAIAQAPPPSSNPPMAPLDGMVLGLIAVSVSYGYVKTKRAT